MQSGAPHGESNPRAVPVPYRGPDRRGVARFVVPARAPTIALTTIALAFVLTRTAFSPRPSPVAVTELGAIAATLGVLGGIVVGIPVYHLFFRKGAPTAS